MTYTAYQLDGSPVGNRRQQLAKLCRDIYLPYGLADFGGEVIEHSSVRCEIVREDRSSSTGVVFRGTVPPGDDFLASLRNWLYNLESHKFDWRPVIDWVRVHHGFTVAWSKIKEDVKRAIRGDCIFTGHSLGGALATIAAMDFATLSSIRIKAVVTFGSPRVGNGKFARSYTRLFGDVTERYVNYCDPVPLFPGALLGFRHVCPPRWWNGKEWKRHTGIWPWIKAAVCHRRFLADHHIDSYINLKDEAGLMQMRKAMK